MVNLSNNLVKASEQREEAKKCDPQSSP